MTNPQIDLNRSWLMREQVMLDQPVKGYRAGLDAVLLAASLHSSGAGTHFLEAGSGAGAALLCAATRLGDTQFTGIERDKNMLSLAQHNIALNKLEDRVQALAGDVSDRPDSLLNQYDHVFSNPPFFDPSAIQEVHPGRAGAYLADVSLEGWIKFMLHAVKPRGRITIIHRAAELAQLLSIMDRRFGEIEVLPIRPMSGRAAKRVLITARKGLRRGEVVLHDGLTLYEAPDQLSARMLEIQSGAALEWR